MSTIIESIEQRQLRKDIPRFKAGDTVRVHFQVIEGQRRRVQVFEGIVIKRQGSGARETFTVRKQSFGVGVERTFPVHSPKIEKIEVGAIGDVNRAKLYYLREKVGKKARVRELRQTPAQVAAAKAEAEANQAAIDAAAAEAEAEAAAEPAAEAEPEVEAAPAEPEASSRTSRSGQRPRRLLPRSLSPRPRRPTPEAVDGRARRGRDVRPTRRLTRSRSAAGLTAFALVAAGCGAEDAAAGSCARGGAEARARARRRLGLRRRGRPLHRSASRRLVPRRRDGPVHVRGAPAARAAATGSVVASTATEQRVDGRGWTNATPAACSASDPL